MDTSDERLEALRNEYRELIKQLSDSEFFRAHQEELPELQKRFVYLEKIVKKEKELQDVMHSIKENEAYIKAREDRELVALAESEIPYLKEREKFLWKELETLLQEEGTKKESVSDSMIMEIRPGTGGEEAALFAADLFRMYKRFCEHRGWVLIGVDSTETDLGGIKEIIFEIRNPEAYRELQFEAGVHRIQRIPITEKTGRIHTSTATVAVLPKPKPSALLINPADIAVETYRASGPGGQYVNRRESAVRVRHKPSGLIVTSQSERSQLANKENALAILRAKLLTMEEEKKTGILTTKRREQIKGAQRSEKIRTYNVPQDRVTDHRIKQSWHNIERIMNGELDEIIAALKQIPRNAS